MKNWITNNILPLLLVAIGFIANDTTLFIDFLTDMKAPEWLFTVVKYIGMIWAAYKLYNSKSSKIRKEIEEAVTAKEGAVIPKKGL